MKLTHHLRNRRDRTPLTRAAVQAQRANKALDAGHLSKARFHTHLALRHLSDVTTAPQVAGAIRLLASRVEQQRGDLTAAYAHAQQACAALTLPESPGDAGTKTERRVSGEDARLAVQCLRQLGAILMWQGEWAQAESLLQQAQTRTRCLPDHIDLEAAQTWNLLGVLYKFWGRFERSEDAYTHAAEYVQHAGRVARPLAATLAHNLGGLAFARGDFDTGEVQAGRSVQLRQALAGAGRQEVVADIAARAAILAQQGRLDDAADDLAGALKIYRRLHGRCHLDWAVTANNLGVVEARRGNQARAARLMNQALRAKEQVLGPDAVDVAVTLINLVDLHLAAGRPDLARALWQRAAAIVEHRAEADHPLARAVQNRAAKVIACDTSTAPLSGGQSSWRKGGDVS
ncbi:tetratricopeptide repeat protein [Streptomyces sp. NPDC047028]|uniref:tetratricopeptide repeat protein n=1 Tax=Streptomyces sp. NPDC047028 TaxID=3155793 RepID=UPI0033D8138B